MDIFKISFTGCIYLVTNCHFVSFACNVKVACLKSKKYFLIDGSLVWFFFPLSLAACHIIQHLVSIHLL